MQTSIKFFLSTTSNFFLNIIVITLSNKIYNCSVPTHFMLGDHLGLKEALDKGFISKDVKRAIVHGNPDRVSEQAKLLKGAKLVAKKRGFITYVGEYNSAKIMISSTGMGSGSASIAIEELIEFGIEKIIRVGTCGGYLNEIKPGDLVVPTATLIETPVLRYLYPNYMH